MGNKKRINFLPGIVVAGGLAILAMANGCSDTADALGGCDEFNGGASAVSGLSIDAKAKAFVSASADLKAVADGLRADVGAACIQIAKDMHANDTWSDKAAGSDDQTKAACDAAAAQIDAVMKAAGQANVSIALQVSGGQCTVDADAQFKCEAGCTTSGECTPGDITARCDPGELSGQCSAECKGSAVCEGSASVAANCKGSCSAKCTGSCSGDCVGTCDGNSQNGGKCAGKCEGSCSATCDGTCTGECKLEANANVDCGVNVSCRGGCTGTYTAPKCEGEITPPHCDFNAECQANCSGSAQLKAQCTPPQVDLVVVGTASADVTAMVNTLKVNLPKILLAAQNRGELAVKAAGKVAGTASAVVSSAGSLGGKAIACVAAAAEASAKASVSVNVSVQASASVSGKASAGS